VQLIHALSGISVLWPGFGEDYYIGMVRDWLPRMSTNSTFLSVILFAISCHLESRRDSSSLSRAAVRIEQLRLRGDAIRGVNAKLNHLRYRSSDELIMSILFLAVNDVPEVAELPDTSFFDPPLRNINWVETFGLIKFDIMHKQAVEMIIVQRGGIRNIKGASLPWSITL
jgi:hypothetical protein